MSNLLKIKDQNGNWIPIPIATNGITSIVQNSDYTLTIILEDGTVYTTTSIRGEKGEKGERGIQGIQGEKGDPFTYADFTSEQLASLKGEKGDKGDAFEYSDFTPQQLASLKGDKGDKGDKGSDGQDYVLTENDKQEIAGLVDAPVEDVQIDGTSVTTNGVANIPLANSNTYGVVKVGQGLRIDSNNLVMDRATDAQVQAGVTGYRPITPVNQHQSVFYGLAKCAGDTTQSASSNTVGTYTNEAIVAIQKMFGVYKSPWELINDYIVPEDSETVEIITDLGGQPFELTESFIRVYFEPSLTGKNDYVKGNTYIRQTNNEIVYSGGFPTIRYMANGTITYSEYRQELIGDILRTDVRTGNSASNTQGVQSMSTDSSVHTSSIMGIRLRQYNDTSTLIPSGTHIQIYGRRKV